MLSYKAVALEHDLQLVAEQHYEVAQKVIDHKKSGGEVVCLTARNSDSHAMVELVKVAAAYSSADMPVRCQKAAQFLSSRIL